MKIKTFLATTAVVAIVGVNAYYATSDSLLVSELNIDNVENFAEGEKTPWNSFFDWFSQGMKKDESEIPYTCYISNGKYSKALSATATGNAGGENWGVDGTVSYNESDYHDYTFTYTAINCGSGYTNCTRIRCR